MKHLLILISFLLLSSPLFGDNHKVEKICTIIDGCRIIDGETLYGWGKYPDWNWVEFGEKDTHPMYQGEVKDGKPNGLGIMTYPDGHKYVGEFKDGLPNGQGTETYSTGEKYIGDKDGKRNGHVTFIYFIRGDKYVGEFKDGQRHGQGTYTFGKGEFEGDKYVGKFKDGKIWNGTKYYKNGYIRYIENGEYITQ